VVSADGNGVVSHAGVGLLREVAEYTGLVKALDGALLDTYRGVPVHAPGRVFTDLAVAVADGSDQSCFDLTIILGKVRSFTSTRPKAIHRF